jgi:hypothetical protein
MEAAHADRIADGTVTDDQAAARAHPGIWGNDDLDWVGDVNVQAVNPSCSEACEDGLAGQETLPSGQETPRIVPLSGPAVKPSR